MLFAYRQHNHPTATLFEGNLYIDPIEMDMQYLTATPTWEHPTLPMISSFTFITPRAIIKSQRRSHSTEYNRVRRRDLR